LPDSFGNIEVDGSLYLCYNQLTTLSENFVHVKETVNTEEQITLEMDEWWYNVGDEY